MIDAAKREQIIGEQIGAHIAPITSADDLIGDWEMRFGGPSGSDKVQWRYAFHADGSVDVSNEQWRWQFNADGTLTLISGEIGDAEETEDEDAELVFPYRADDGRLILSNDDSSLIEVLTRVAG